MLRGRVFGGFLGGGAGGKLGADRGGNPVASSFLGQKVAVSRVPECRS